MTNFTLAKRLFFCSDILKCITLFSDFSSHSYNMTNPTSWLDPWTCEIFYFPQSQTVTAISTNVGIYVTLAKGSIFCYDIWYLEIYHCRHPKVNITFALALKFIPSLSFTLFQFISGENTVPSYWTKKSDQWHARTSLLVWRKKTESCFLCYWAAAAFKWLERSCLGNNGEEIFQIRASWHKSSLSHNQTGKNYRWEHTNIWYKLNYWRDKEIIFIGPRYTCLWEMFLRGCLAGGWM